MRLVRTLLAAGALLAALPEPASAAVGLKKVGDFTHPVYVAGAPGDYSRLYVVEQPGTVRVVRDGTTLAEPFLDLTGAVLDGGERGLLSIAFPIDFQRSRLFYVYFTEDAADPAGDGDIRVEQLRAPSGDRADPASRRLVLEILHRDHANHNGGQLQFGPDGYLYLATGDGGGDHDPDGNAQKPGSLLGKVLRISPGAAGGYAVPPGNPFGTAVWARGLRNPYRFSFDRVTGDLTIGDVGEATTEEVDFSPLSTGGGRGANYGWDPCEGSFATDTKAPCPFPGFVGPVIDKFHSDGWCALIGGYVVRDPSLPALYGRYVYGDNCNFADQRIRSAVLRTPKAAGDAVTPLEVPLLSSFGEDAAGCVYATALDGPVYRLVETTATVPCPAPPGTPAGPATGSDTTPPLLGARVPRRQRVLRRRGVIAYARSNEAGTVTLTARLRIGRRSYRLRFARRTVAAGRRVRLRARLTRRASRALRRALRERRRARVPVRLRALDAEGNRSRLVRRTVRVRR